MSGKRKGSPLSPSEPERKIERRTKTSADGGSAAVAPDQTSEHHRQSSTPQSRQRALFDQLEEMSQARWAELLSLFAPLRPSCQKPRPMLSPEWPPRTSPSPTHPTSVADPATKGIDACHQESQDAPGPCAVAKNTAHAASLADPAMKEKYIAHQEIQDAAGPCAISNKTSDAASELDARQEDINLYVLLAKHGGNAAAYRHPGHWSHFENWVLSSVQPDGAPWASKLSDHSAACAFVQELSVVLRESVRMKLLQIMEDGKGAYQKLIEEHWQSYEKIRFLEWERRGVLAVERELLRSNCEPRPVQMLMWQTNSCAVDAMLTVLPRVALNAHAKGLYKDDNLVASPAATIIAGLQLCECTTENKQLGSHRAISNWIRHLAADLARYKGSNRPFWSVFDKNQGHLDIVDKMSVDFPRLLGYSDSTGPEAFVSVKFHLLHLQTLDVCIQGTKESHMELLCTDLLVSLFPGGKRIPSGIYVVALPPLSDHESRQDVAKALTSGWRTVTGHAPGNEGRCEIEFLAVVGYKNDGKRDHFISGISVAYKDEEFIFLHDGMANNGSQTKITAQQAFLRSDPGSCAIFDISHSLLVFSVCEHR